MRLVLCSLFVRFDCLFMFVCCDTTWLKLLVVLVVFICCGIPYLVVCFGGASLIF